MIYWRGLKFPVFIVIYFLAFNVIQAQRVQETAYAIDTIEDNFTAQLEIFPQEKLHLHTDRDMYVPGEKIWFKAYVVDAHTHLYPTYSQYVYVELISPADTLVQRVMVKQIDGMLYGHLPIAEGITEGNYTLRAYTRYMENMGDDYFFKKNIRIGNISSDKSLTSQSEWNERNGGNRGNDERSEGRVNLLAMQSKEEFFSRREKNGGIKTNLSSNGDYDVSFFPEGGNLVEGALCKIAFKALSKTGHAAAISGKLIDDAGIEITEVTTQHAGMGMFMYTPLPDKKYFLKCRNENGLEKQFELPQTNPQAYTLTISPRSTNLVVEVRRSAHASEIPLYLLAHCRGMVLYFAEWEKEKNAVVFAQDRFPAGVIQFVLFDNQMNPLSERLVFSKNYEEAKVEFETDKPVYEKREKVIAKLSEIPSLTPSLSGRDGVGLFSISITDDRDMAVDESTTILSSFLLSSELKGYIDNPAYYLQDTKESAIALDYLMMTHGWRRYNVPEVVQGHITSPQIPFQMAQEISGSVKSVLFNRVVPNSEISIFTKGVFWQSTADSVGLFRLQDIEFPDSTTFFIQALNRRGSDNVKLVMDNESFPAMVYAPQSHLTPTLSKGEEVIAEVTNSFITKAEQRSKYDDDIRVVNLAEIEVTAKRIEKKDPFKEPRLQYWANRSSDKTITRKDFEKYGQSIRTVSSFLSLYYAGKNFDGFDVRVDGFDRSNSDELKNMTMDEVESIDLFIYASTIVFQGRPTVSITTRRGGDSGIKFEKYNYAVYNPLGFQQPIEFYSPKYETIEARQSPMPDLRTTIYWKPDIVISAENDEATFEFYTSDFPTTYSLVIEGLTADGRIVRQVEKIRVE